MRFFDTGRFIDQLKNPILDLYESRIGKPFHELQRSDLGSPEVLRAVLEAKMYHLPHLFQIPAALRPYIKPTTESQLFDETQFSDPNARIVCPTCKQAKFTYGEFHPACLDCWDERLAALWEAYPSQLPARGYAHAQALLNAPQNAPLQLYHLYEEAAWQGVVGDLTVNSLKAFLRLTRVLLRKVPSSGGGGQAAQVWSTPKKAFMAAEVGCQECGCTHKVQDGWLWAEDMSDWKEGLCPICAPNAEVFPAHYVWGMHPAAYLDWQDGYHDKRKIFRVAQAYGSLSLLLVSTDYRWVKLLSLSVPTAPNHTGCMGISAEPVGSVHRKPRTLEAYRAGEGIPTYKGKGKL